jgi:hypothetical protein
MEQKSWSELDWWDIVLHGVIAFAAVFALGFFTWHAGFGWFVYFGVPLNIFFWFFREREQHDWNPNIGRQQLLEFTVPAVTGAIGGLLALLLF